MGAWIVFDLPPVRPQGRDVAGNGLFLELKLGRERAAVERAAGPEPKGDHEQMPERGRPALGMIIPMVAHFRGAVRWGRGWSSSSTPACIAAQGVAPRIQSWRERGVTPQSAAAAAVPWASTSGRRRAENGVVVLMVVCVAPARGAVADDQELATTTRRLRRP